VEVYSGCMWRCTLTKVVCGGVLSLRLFVEVYSHSGCVWRCTLTQVVRGGVLSLRLYVEVYSHYKVVCGTLLITRHMVGVTRGGGWDVSCTLPITTCLVSLK
jgi:hypothetical protein